jgi:hypothetical protein
MSSAVMCGMYVQGQALVQFKHARFVAQCITASTDTTRLLGGKKLTISKSKFPAVVETPLVRPDESKLPIVTSTTIPAKSVSTASMFRPRRLTAKPSAMKPKLTTPGTNVDNNRSSSQVSGSGSGSGSVCLVSTEKSEQIGLVDSAACSTSQGEATSAAAKANSDFRKFFQ